MGILHLLANPNHVYSTDGYYSVSVRFEDLTGCVDSFDFDIISYPIPQANFTAQQLDTCVLPLDYNLQNSTIGAATYDWDFGDGFNSSTLASPLHSFSNAGNYDIKLISSNAYGCVDSISTSSIVVDPVPISQFDAVQLDTCILLQIII